MKRQFFFKSLFISLICIPVFVGATTVDEIQTQIQSLLEQMVVLQKQSETKSGSTFDTSILSNTCPNLSKTLSYGSRGGDVISLQRFFIAQGLLGADLATGFFGPATEVAVKKWQTQNSIVSSGNAQTTGYGVVGVRTRESIVTHCKKTVVKTPVVETEEEKIFAQPFVDAGCTRKENGMYDCKKATFASKCKSLGDGGYLHESGVGGNELGIPMIACSVQIENFYGNAKVQSQYFSCSGGLAPSCIAYIGYVNGKFKAIRNPADLMRIIGQISTPEQAQYLVLLSTYAVSTQVQPLLSDQKPLLDTPGPVAPYRLGDDFVVTLYEPEYVFGCFSKNTYYRVVFHVSTDGKILKTDKKEAVYVDDLGGGICID